ncbi:glutathione S-transferase family protein [uncultured Paraglaciecola sp.]|uniref:glutathione S-transferase family protein n=1 Tax=uncultured Paraglaciecola sp. TaxID=1765024 RepID=UPI0025922F60|nr:glutathione S-transferase family protein [uncultured Paraglaciecola sp.]
MKKVKIYGIQFSTYTRVVQLVCEEKGIAYDIGFEVNHVPVAFKDKEHSQYHPYKKIPMLVDGDKVLCESLAICRYLDSTIKTNPLMPTDTWLAAKVDEWCQLAVCYINSAIIKNYILELIFPKGVDNQIRFDVMQQMKPAALEALAIVTNQLVDQDYLLGETFTLADAMLAPSLYYARHLPEKFKLIEAGSTLDKYIERLEQRPSGQKVLIPKGE